MAEQRASFDPAMYDRLSTGSVPGYAALQELVALAVAAVEPAPRKVLDLGCGTGAGLLALARAIPGAQLVACDPVAPMVATARARCEQAGVAARFFVGALPAVAAEAPFDAVVCTLVLQFVPPDERGAFLRDVRQSLAPGGALVISVLGRSAIPDVERVWARIRRHHAATQGVTAAELAAREAETRGKVHPLSPEALGAALADAGFSSVTPLYQLLAVHGCLART